MKTSTLFAASVLIASGSIATAPQPAHGQSYGYGYVVPQYPSPDQYTRTIYMAPPPTWQTHCPRPTSRGIGRMFDAMDCGTRYFFDY